MIFNIYKYFSQEGVDIEEIDAEWSLKEYSIQRDFLFFLLQEKLNLLWHDLGLNANSLLSNKTQMQLNKIS